MTHIDPSEIAAFRERRLDRARIEAVGAHVRTCGECARLVWGDPAIVASSQVMWKAEEPPAARWRVGMAWAAAVVLIAALAIWIWTSRSSPQVARDDVPPPAPPPAPAATRVVRDGAVAITLDASGAVRDVSTPRPEWRNLVAAALRSGVAPASETTALAGSPTVLRGTGGAPPVTLLEPVGIVVESDRPRFRWTEIRDARYRVLVARDGDLVASSESQSRSTWTPPAPLRRGAVYAWQLAIEIADREWTVPSPDARPARFRVLAEDEKRELDAARATGSRLLTGLIAARLGLGDVAARELRAFASEHAEIAAARQLAGNYPRPAPTTTNGDQ